MKMQDYLAEMEHATSQAIALVWSEREKLRQLTETIQCLTAEMEAGYNQVDFLAMNPDLDDDNLSTAIHWDTYFGPDKDRHYALKDKELLQALIPVRTFSTGAQSGSLLQYAKQGISLVHGNLSSCPSGRQVGSQALKNVIWQSRNHSLHWEDGNPHPPVVQCFEALARDFGPQFLEYRTRNLGFDVVEVLGWRTFEDFKKDMLTL